MGPAGRTSCSRGQAAREPEAPCVPAELWRHQRLTLSSEGPLIYSWEKGMAKKKLLFLSFKHNFSPSYTVGRLPTQDFREPGSRPRFALTNVTSPLWVSIFPSGERWHKESKVSEGLPHTNILLHCPPPSLGEKQQKVVSLSTGSALNTQFLGIPLNDDVTHASQDP